MKDIGFSVDSSKKLFLCFLAGAQSLHSVKLIMTDSDSQEISQVDFAISTYFVNAVRPGCGWHLVEQGWRQNCKGVGYQRGKDDAAKR